MEDHDEISAEEEAVTEVYFKAAADTWDDCMAVGERLRQKLEKLERTFLNGPSEK